MCVVQRLVSRQHPRCVMTEVRVASVRGRMACVPACLHQGLNILMASWRRDWQCSSRCQHLTGKQRPREPFCCWSSMTGQLKVRERRCWMEL